ncbi:MAG: hypothetical protein ACD_18C00302G0005 [uncultured bacterium]|nr:MAG: hypothetical protein ACD_18C00302G0005 [uncultured bacterium]
MSNKIKFCAQSTVLITLHVKKRVKIVRTRTTNVIVKLSKSIELVDII